MHRKILRIVEDLRDGKRAIRKVGSIRGARLTVFSIHLNFTLNGTCRGGIFRLQIPGDLIRTLTQIQGIAPGQSPRLRSESLQHIAAHTG